MQMTRLAMLAVSVLLVVPAQAVDNFYSTSTKLDIGQFAGNCANLGGDFTAHGNHGGTCKTDSGLDVTCVRDDGLTTCAGNVPETPKAPT
jgi:hypothetical protein